MKLRVIRVTCPNCGNKEAEAVLVSRQPMKGYPNNFSQEGFQCFNCRTFEKLLIYKDDYQKQEKTLKLL